MKKKLILGMLLIMGVASLEAYTPYGPAMAKFKKSKVYTNYQTALQANKSSTAYKNWQKAKKVFNASLRNAYKKKKYLSSYKTALNNLTKAENVYWKSATYKTYLKAQKAYNAYLPKTIAQQLMASNGKLNGLVSTGGVVFQNVYSSARKDALTLIRRMPENNASYIKILEYNQAMSLAIKKYLDATRRERSTYNKKLTDNFNQYYTKKITLKKYRQTEDSLQKNYNEKTKKQYAQFVKEVNDAAKNLK